MKEFSLDYIHCISCGSKLELDVIKKQNEIQEGFLKCTKCESIYPIIEKIPIIWDDFASYISSRRKLAGQLINSVSPKMKRFLKNSLKSSKKLEDRTNIEQRWTNIYQNSRKSRFYISIKNEIQHLSPFKFAIEYGCSIGILSNAIADSCQIGFGLDRSYSAIQIAKKTSRENIDYFVTDSLIPVFKGTKFDLVLALNVLELIEPAKFLDHITDQIRDGFLLISDPYDYDRGNQSVRKPLYETTLRQNLKDRGFKIIKKTEPPSYLPWTLKLNERASLNYKVDLVIAKK